MAWPGWGSLAGKTILPYWNSGFLILLQLEVHPNGAGPASTQTHDQFSSVAPGYASPISSQPFGQPSISWAPHYQDGKAQFASFTGFARFRKIWGGGSWVNRTLLLDLEIHLILCWTMEETLEKSWQKRKHREHRFKKLLLKLTLCGVSSPASTKAHSCHYGHVSTWYVPKNLGRSPISSRGVLIMSDK